MGSWSESCGFSGMEIGEGDVAYICLIAPSKHGSLNDGAFRHFVPTTTLIKGIYNDYGYLSIDDDPAILALFNQQSGLNLEQGDDFSIDNTQEHRWWIHGKAFDFLQTITPEFPYASDPDSKTYASIPIKDIRESMDLTLKSMRKTLTEARAEVAKLQALEDSDVKDIMIELAMTGGKMRDLIGYRDTPGLDMKALKTADDIEPHLTSYARISMLGYALGEIRRNLARNESIGPQWGGHVALRQLGQFLVSVTS